MSAAGALIRAELLKLRTVRTFWWLAAVALAWVPAGIAVAILGSGRKGAVSLDSSEGIRNAVGAGSTGVVLLIVAGILVVAGEFRFNTITSTFLITPHRKGVIGAKLATSLLVGFAVGIAISLLTLAIAVPWLASRNVELGPHVGDIAVVLLGIVGSTALGGLLGAGLGATITSQTSAVTVALVWIFLVEALVGNLASGIGRWLPAGAASAMLDGGLSTATLLPMWAGGLVLTGYALAFSGIGARLVVQRDVA